MSAFHRQCVLQRGDTIQVSWIPECFATFGKYLKLFDEDVDAWENGWKVVQVGGRKQSADVNIRSRDFLKTRRASDI